MDLPYAQQYMKENPGKIRQVKGTPVAIFPTTIALAVGEYQLKNYDRCDAERYDQ